MHQMKLLERNVDLMEEADSWSCVSAGSSNKLTAEFLWMIATFIWDAGKPGTLRNGTERNGREPVSYRFGDPVDMGIPRP